MALEPEPQAAPKQHVSGIDFDLLERGGAPWREWIDDLDTPATDADHAANANMPREEIRDIAPEVKADRRLLDRRSPESPKSIFGLEVRAEEVILLVYLVEARTAENARCPRLGRRNEIHR